MRNVFEMCFFLCLCNFVDSQMSTHANSLYPVLFETLSNNSDEVVIQGLTVLAAQIVNCTNKSKGNVLRNFEC